MADDIELECVGPDPLFPLDGNFYRTSNGFYFSDSVGGPIVRKWLKENFEARDDDIYVVSHPKTGTTWAQEIAYLIASDLDFAKAKAQSLYKRFPILDLKRAVEDGRISALSSPRFLKTHFPFSLLPQSIHDKKCKMIYTIRNPKDTIVSYYHFYRTHKFTEYSSDFDTFINCFIESKITYSPYWKHVLEFWEHRHQSNILILFYEDMKKDLLAQIKRVASFFGKTLTEAQILQVAEHCHFDSMKNNPSTNYDNDLGKEGFKFYRKGKVGDWKDMFSEEMSEKIDEYCSKYFKNTGLTFSFEIDSEKNEDLNNYIQLFEDAMTKTKNSIACIENGMSELQKLPNSLNNIFISLQDISLKLTETNEELKEMFNMLDMNVCRPQESTDQKEHVNLPEEKAEEIADQQENVNPPEEKTEEIADQQEIINPLEGMAEESVNIQQNVNPPEEKAEEIADQQENVNPPAEKAEEIADQQENVNPTEGKAEVNTDQQENVNPTEGKAEVNTDQQENVNPTEGKAEVNTDQQENVNPTEGKAEVNTDQQENVNPSEGKEEESADQQENVNPPEEKAEESTDQQENVNPPEEKAEVNTDQQENVNPTEEKAEVNTDQQENVNPPAEKAEESTDQQENVNPPEGNAEENTDQQENVNPPEGKEEESTDQQENVNPPEGKEEESTDQQENVNPPEEKAEESTDQQENVNPPEIKTEESAQQKEIVNPLEGMAEESINIQLNVNPPEEKAEEIADQQENVNPPEEKAEESADRKE